MKTMLLMGFLISWNSVVNAQQIRKMNVLDLEKYISSSTHPLVVNFWATWCAPCLEEMPWFSQTVKKFNDKKVELILVSLDNPKAFPEKIRSVIQAKKPDATFIWLNESDADYFCPKIDSTWSGSIPATLLVNSQKGQKKFLEQQVSLRQLETELLLLTK